MESLSLIQQMFPEHLLCAKHAWHARGMHRWTGQLCFLLSQKLPVRTILSPVIFQCVSNSFQVTRVFLQCMYWLSRMWPNRRSLIYLTPLVAHLGCFPFLTLSTAVIPAAIGYGRLAHSTSISTSFQMPSCTAGAGRVKTAFLRLPCS